MAPGHVLLHEGDPGEAVYLICSGSVRVYKADASHADGTLELARLGVGEIIGELGPILGHLRTASVQTLEPTRVLELPVDRLRELLKEQRPLLRVLTQALRDRSGLNDSQISERAAGAGLDLALLDDAEAVDVTDAGDEADSAAGVASADGHSLPVPAYDADLCYPKRVDCPACGTRFSALVIHARKDQPVERSSDFHNTYATPYNPYDYELWVCPNDLYAALPADFPNLRDTDRQAVARVVEEVVAVWGDDIPDFNAERSLALRERSLELALALYRMRGEPATRLAAITHRLAWCARERDDLEAEKSWLRMALEQYVKAFQESNLGDTKEELRVQYLCGEINLRLGDVPAALTWFAQALREPKLKDHQTWERMIREQWSVARSGSRG